MTETSNVYRKWLNVMASVNYVQKTGRNDYHKYNYVQEADLLEAIRPAMIENNLVLYPEDMTVLSNTGSIITIKYIYRVVDTETGESFTLSNIAQGADSADKGVYKSHTGSMKYLLLKSLLVPSGDDPETDVDTNLGKVQNPKAVFTARKMMETGLFDHRDQIEKAIGMKINMIPDDENGTALLRKLYNVSSKFSSGEITIEDVIKQVTE